MEPPIPGTVLAERYVLVKPLGAGGSATVWKAMDTSLHRAVAVKLLRGTAVNDPTERERLRREARVLARLAHPRISAIWDYAEAPMPDGSTVPVLVTELLSGRSLSNRLAEGPLPWPEAVSVCAQLADALLAAHHAGVVHRDVKPANVMLVADGAKLLDFGIARATGDGDLTGNLTVGTPLCMSPEQVRGRRARPASDIYALGCVLYWALTGRPPYQSGDVTEIFEAQLYDPPPPIDVPGLPARVVEFCHACLSKNPEFRPNAARALTILSGFSAREGEQRSGEPRPQLEPVREPVREPVLEPVRERGAFEPPRPAGTEPARLGPATSPTAQETAAWNPPHLSPRKGSRGRRLPRPAALVAASLVGALAVVGAAVLLLGNHGSGAVGHASGVSSGVPAVSAVPSGGDPQPLPEQSTAGLAAGSPTVSASPAADPIAYLEAVRAQIRTFVADGPATLNPITGGDLQNSITDIENSVISARRNGGKAHLEEIRNKISQFDGRLNGLVGKGRVSSAAASELTLEVQRLSNTVTD
jgi:serine/threonine protein kinase